VPTPPPAINEVLGLLRRSAAVLVLLLIAIPLHGQETDAVSRYRGGDYAGAARAFEGVVRLDPHAAVAWRDLGSARWLDGDDVGATAAWITALRLAPRDPLLELAWQAAATAPSDVRSLAPRIPVSRDELILLTLAGWLGVWGCLAFRARRVALGVGVLTLFCLATAVSRSRAEQLPIALIRPGAVLRIAPTAASPSISAVSPWSIAEVDDHRDAWVIVTMADGTRGWLPDASIAPIGPLD
jgi:hypothetical protein